ncbi:MAG: hypothetical protein FWD44_05955 [Oscillospiraceae bacterium]|nr:hypothetical protein [Oscillospiraceae bacterium]
MPFNNESLYKDLCKKFGDTKLPQRTAYLYHKMNAFIEAAKVDDIAFVDLRILAHVVFDYFCDISRLKDFHIIEKINKSKITSYTAFWVARRKPIQIVKGKHDDSVSFINEAFVTTYIVDELSNSITTNKTDEHLKEQILYHLKYRQFDAQTLELMINSHLLGKTPNKSITDEA